MIIIPIVLILGAFWVFGGNYIFHKYAESKKKSFFKSIENLDYELIDNVKIKHRSNATYHFGSSYSVSNADLIYVEHNLFVLQFRSYFGNKIKISQPIIQYYFDKERLIIDGIIHSQKIDDFKLEQSFAEINSHKFMNNKLLSRNDKLIIQKKGIENALKDMNEYSRLSEHLRGLSNSDLFAKFKIYNTHRNHT